MRPRAKLKAYQISHGNRARRAVWRVCWILLARFSPVFAHRWRVLLLRIFGAKVEWTAHVYPSARIWAPWNLVLGARSCLASNVDCYNVARVSLAADSTVSQSAVLCTASHDFDSPDARLVVGEIELGPRAWVFSYAFVGPGVTLSEGAVLMACGVLLNSTEPWQVYAGNPAVSKRMRSKLQI